MMVVKPMSPMQPWPCESKKMFDDLMFPWMSLPLFPSWILAKPLAAPVAILNLASQSKGTRSYIPLFPAPNNIEHFSFDSRAIKIICS